MSTQVYHNMSSDFTVLQAFLTSDKKPLKDAEAKDVREVLQEQIAWTEEQIAQLQQHLEELQCILEYQAG